MLCFWQSDSKVSKERQNFYPRELSLEMKVELILFVVYKDCAICFLGCTSGKFNQSGLKKLISGNC